MDSIGDFLTTIRNAIKANHRVVEVKTSFIKEEITKILHEKGYILDYKVEEAKPQGTLKLALKYHPVTKLPAIRSIRRVSTPGMRKYSGKKTLPRVLNGLGIAIVSTSKGLMSDKEARKQNIGGEVLCYIY